MGLVKDLWRVGVLPCRMESILETGGIVSSDATWLPSPGPLAFYADPFGIWRGDELYIFVELYDYRRRHGTIDVFTLDRGLSIKDRRTALEEPWHLSYPFVFEHDGELYLLPEAHKSGDLTLYRAERFPDRWSAVSRFALNPVPIDATPLFYEGRWWLFYTPDSPERDKTRALNVAFADGLFGPWRNHANNPVIYDVASARPGGSPCSCRNGIVIPVQDCSRTYGGGLRSLSISKLTPDEFDATPGSVLHTPADWSPFNDIHTLSSAGEVTLVDAKRGVVTGESLLLDIGRQLSRLPNIISAPFIKRPMCPAKALLHSRA